MARTTIRLKEEVLREAKRVAAASGRTFTQLVEDSLMETLARRRPVKPKKKIDFLTFGEGGLQPGVDISDSAGLLAIMEARDDPS